MSLFKTIEYWSTQNEDDEYFDLHSLLLTRLNLCDFELIVTGSQSGILRILQSSKKHQHEDEAADNNEVVLDSSNLIIEKVFEYPILQVGCGRFISGDQHEQIALLHPRSIIVCSLRIGGTEFGSQNYLDTVYEHKLSRTAFNFTIGPFGGAQNRDFICVQSVDGLLSFFEQESPSFSCFLPNVLLPGPLAYIKKSDTFIVNSGDWLINAYTYKTLSQMGEENGNRESFNPDWRYNLGEAIIDINVLEEADNLALLLILGERNLFCFNYWGTLKYMKRLEYPPTAFCSYFLDNTVITLITSETETLLIYQNTTLRWSAKLNFAPICIRRAFLDELMKGALVFLSDEGSLKCCYLGAEPMLFITPPLKQKATNDNGHVVNNKNKNDRIKTTTKKDLKLIIRVDENFGDNYCNNDETISKVFNPQMCHINIDLTPQTVFQEIQLTPDINTPLKITPQVCFFTNISEKTSVSSTVYISEDAHVPPSLKFNLIATIVSNIGVPKCLKISSMLPLSLVAKSGESDGDGEHKITLNINQSQVSLLTLFRDFPLLDSSYQTANSIHFRIHGDGIVKILSAKNSQRYRIQSNSFTALSLFIEQFIYKLQTYYNATKDDVRVNYNFPIPTKEVIAYVIEHFNRKAEVILLEDELMHYSSQYRLFQKRLIQKLKTKNPTQLKNTEILLVDTHRNILRTYDSLQIANKKLLDSEAKVSCCLYILQHLIRMMSINEKLQQCLVFLFGNYLSNLESQSWEEILDRNMCYLLRNELAKSQKDKMRLEHFNTEDVVDLSRVTKHLGQVLERITTTSNKSIDYVKQQSEME